MSLSIVPTDVLAQIGNIFNSLWVTLAIGLGLMVAPQIIRIAKGTLGDKRYSGPLESYGEWVRRTKPFMRFRVTGRRTVSSTIKALPRKGVYRKRRFAGSVLPEK